MFAPLPHTRGRVDGLILSCVLLSACSGVQSALQPAGDKASHIAQLFWIMTAGGTLIFLAFVGLSLYAVYFRCKQHTVQSARRLIVGGAVVFPSILLAVLLVYGLLMLPDQLAAAPSGSLRIQVSGLQWWWRVRYQPAHGQAFESANEITIPVGETVQFELDSPDVIHSFWIPNLAGKVDMIPGRTTRLALTATRAGTYRGACAEYCGTSHAFMAFPVVVLEKAAFQRWLAKQASHANEGSESMPGGALFQENGCGACHTIRGTGARGEVGPDLTHVGSRLSLGAGVFARSADHFERWIAQTEKLKPGVHMPSFGMLPPQNVRELALYLESLR